MLKKREATKSENCESEDEDASVWLEIGKSSWEITYPGGNLGEDIGIDVEISGEVMEGAATLWRARCCENVSL